MIVDTDVLIWYMRGNARAQRVIDDLGRFEISAVTYMEVLQGIRNQGELRTFKRFLVERGIACISIDPSISDRALYLMERYALSHAMKMGDALIAATADIRGETLLTGNVADYRMLSGIRLSHFKPKG